MTMRVARHVYRIEVIQTKKQQPRAVPKPSAKTHSPSISQEGMGNLCTIRQTFAFPAKSAIPSEFKERAPIVFFCNFTLEIMCNLMCKSL